MFPLTHLSLKILPNGTAFDVIFVDSPIFNRNIVHRVSNMIWWKYFMTTTNSNKGSIDTKNLPQRIIGQWKGVGYMAWKWIRISLKSRMVSWYKNKIVRAGVSNCMRQCLNFLVLNVHIPAYLGSRGKPFFWNFEVFCYVCQL